MAIVVFAGNQAGAGKTCLIAGLLHLLREAGRNPAYYKPFSPTPDSDPDVVFLSQFLADDGPPVPPPVSLPTDGASLDDSAVQEITGAIAALDVSGNIVLIEAPGTSSLAAGLASRLNANGLSAQGVLVAAYEKGLTPSTVQSMAQPWGESLMGVVFNYCPPYRQEQLAREVIGPLREENVPALGTLTEDRPLLSVTVQQIADHLGGSWVQEPDNTAAAVDRFLIGGNIMDSGPNYFGRYSNQAVITRAERPDIQLAGLMCDTKCLVLTGGGEPTEYIRVEAATRGVPLISVDLDTIAAAEALQGIFDRSTVHHLSKVRRAAYLIQERLPSLLSSVLGLGGWVDRGN